MAYFLVIDAGTGSGRALIFNRDGEQVAISQEEWTHKSEDGVLGSMSFSCSLNWELICRCIKSAIRDANIDSSQIVSVSSSSMREGIVLYDRDGVEIFGVANVDGRAFREVEELKREDSTKERRFYELSGQTYALGAIPRILWLKKNKKAIYEKIAKIGMISDWVLYKLSGEFTSDPSNAGTSGIFSLEKRDWAREIASECGVVDTIFPEISESGRVVGKVNKRASKESGLKEGTLVVVGGGDVQLGCAGLGVVKKGDSALLGGTFWQQLINLDKPIVDKNMKIRVNPHVIPSLYQAEAITFFVGVVTRWFRDLFCQDEIQKAKDRGVDTYTLLEELAKSVDVGSNGIVPIFSDVMDYGNWYHASPSFLNLNLDPNICSKGAIFRSILENAAIVSAINFENIGSFSGVESSEIVFAGGASKGSLWPEIVADVLGKKIKIPKVKEATSLGAAMAAGVGAGEYRSIEEVSKSLIKWEREIEPNMSNHKKYIELKERWSEVYKIQKECVDRKLLDSMWRAPGA